MYKKSIVNTLMKKRNIIYDTLASTNHTTQIISNDLRESPELTIREPPHYVLYFFLKDHGSR